MQACSETYECLGGLLLLAVPTLVLLWFMIRTIDRRK